VRLEKNGQVTVLADRYKGKRLNSPNDLVYRSDGSLYFTDPPFGLPKVFDDSQKELSVSGVYRWKEGLITQLTTDLKGPNGIAFSPDEKYLYVSNWDPSKKYLMRYPVLSDGRLGKGILFFDMGRVSGEDALDGIKVDVKGNVYAVGPQGIWVLSPEGKWLARIELPEHVANCAWGDIDGRSLYITASSGLYRIRLKNAGSGIHRFSTL
jgi:gluconolactonase